jgi:N-methylhydantoinase A
VDKFDPDRVRGLYEEMRGKAVETLLSERIPRDKMVMSLTADVRYIGQFNEVEVPVESEEWAPETIERLLADFHRRHEALNGYRMPTAPVEIVNLRVVGTGMVEKPEFLRAPIPDRPPPVTPIGSRRAFFDAGLRDVPVYDGLQLTAQSRVTGPAIVEQATTTVVVQPGYELMCDDLGNTSSTGKALASRRVSPNCGKESER